MKYLLYVVLIILLVPFQAVMYNRLAVFGVHADLVLIAVCLIGLQAGELDAIVVGIALGFTQDLFTGSAHWENLWLKPLLGLLASVASHNVVNLTVSFSLALLLALSVFSGSVMFLLKTFQGPGVDFLAAARGIILPQACYDAVLGIIVLKLVQWATPTRLQVPTAGYE
jgi:rod shape-determining protein MreD